MYNNIRKYDLDVNFDKFCNFNMFTAESWSQVILHISLHGLVVDFNTILFFLHCSLFLKNIRKMFLHTLSNTNLLDDYLTFDFLTLLYKLTSKDYLASKQYLTAKWQFDDYFESLGTKFGYYNWTNSSNELNPTERFQFFDVIEMKKPILLLQFFVKNRRHLWQSDAEFVKYIYAKAKKLAKKDMLFSQINEELEKEQSTQLRLNMFIN